MVLLFFFLFLLSEKAEKKGDDFLVPCVILLQYTLFLFIRTLFEKTSRLEWPKKRDKNIANNTGSLEIFEKQCFS